MQTHGFGETHFRGSTTCFLFDPMGAQTPILNGLFEAKYLRRIRPISFPISSLCVSGASCRLFVTGDCTAHSWTPVQGWMLLDGVLVHLRAGLSLLSPSLGWHSPPSQPLVLAEHCNNFQVAAAAVSFGCQAVALRQAREALWLSAYQNTEVGEGPCPSALWCACRTRRGQSTPLLNLI